MSIKAVIFDFGGVFTTSPVANFAHYERQNNLPEKFLGGVIKQNHHTNAWAQFERAEITFDEFDRLFEEETRTAGHAVTGSILVSLLSLSFHEPMIQALRDVKAAGFKTGCITNNLPKFDSAAMIKDKTRAGEAEEILTLFDHVIESSKAGVRKPEIRIYEMMCETLEIDPKDCIYLDDLGINLKPARAMGMTTIKVPIGDISSSVEELRTLTGLS